MYHTVIESIYLCQCIHSFIFNPSRSGSLFLTLNGRNRNHLHLTRDRGPFNCVPFMPQVFSHPSYQHVWSLELSSFRRTTLMNKLILLFKLPRGPYTYILTLCVKGFIWCVLTKVWSVELLILFLHPWRKWIEPL